MLKSFGLRDDDPRLQPMMQMVREIELEQEELENETKDPGQWLLNKQQFKRSDPYFCKLKKCIHLFKKHNLAASVQVWI